MKNLTLTSLIISLFALACSKTQNTTGGTTVTPTSPDTSTLRKTAISYSIDGNGNKGDSNVISYTYDANGRLTKRISGIAGGNHYDSNTVTYSGNQSTSISFDYSNSNLVLHSTTIIYLNSHGLADSSQISYSPAVTVVINHYDANEHDTLTEYFDASTNARKFAEASRFYYSGDELDSNVETDANGVRVYKSTWLNGDLVTDSEFVAESLNSAHAYGYNNVAPARWPSYTGTNHLFTSFSQTLFNPFQTFPAETFAYTFDSVNRVKTMTRTESGQIYSGETYTYY